MTRFAQRLGVFGLALVCATAVLFADGGTMLFRKPAGPFMVTVFGEPVPLRAGVADVSVLVERASDQTAVLDAVVILHLKRKEAGTIFEVSARATHGPATNKLLYAAAVNLSSAGMWQMTVDVEHKGEAGSASGEVSVSAAEPPLIEHWPLFAVVPLMILFFVLNQWLKSRRNRRGRLQT